MFILSSSHLRGPLSSERCVQKGVRRLSRRRYAIRSAKVGLGSSQFQISTPIPAPMRRSCIRTYPLSARPVSGDSQTFTKLRLIFFPRVVFLRCLRDLHHGGRSHQRLKFLLAAPTFHRSRALGYPAKALIVPPRTPNTMPNRRVPSLKFIFRSPGTTAAKTEYYSCSFVAQRS